MSSIARALESVEATPGFNCDTGERYPSIEGFLPG